MACPVDPPTHSPAVDVGICGGIVIGYTIDVVIDTVDHAFGRPSDSMKHIRLPEHIKFAEFVAGVLQRTRVAMLTLLVTLVYIQRAKPHLHIDSEQWALVRIFLGALIVASKYLNDRTYSNLAWSKVTGIINEDINRIEREFLDVLNFELKVTEDDISSHLQALKAAAHPPLPHRHSWKARLSRSSPELAPANPSFERRNAPQSHHTRYSSPQDVPELQPGSSSSSESSSSGPATPDSMNGWGDERVRDNPNISGSLLRSPFRPSNFTMVPTLISQPVAGHISAVLDKIRVDTLCIACWEEPKNPAPNLAHLHDFSGILEVWTELELLVRRPTELLAIWSLVEDYEKFIYELRLSISGSAHKMTEDVVNDFHQRLSDYVRAFKADANASNNAPAAPHSPQAVSTDSSLVFFKDIGKVGISGGHFIMNVTQPSIPSPSSSLSETYLKEIRNFTYFRTFIELAILF